MIVSSFFRCFSPTSSDTRSRPTEIEPAFGRVDGADPHARREPLPARFDVDEDQPRGMEAPDALEPVLDLAAELAVGDHDHVHDARRNVGALLFVALGEHVPQRGLDAPRGGVVLAPEVFHRYSPRQRCGAISSSAAVGPAVPDSYVCSGSSSAAHAFRIGSMIDHCAITSSLRVKSVASPRMASRMSRS